MGLAAYLLLLLTHPVEFRTLVQYKIYHEYKRDITAKNEHPTSGWDRATMKRCWKFLDLTTSNFAAVIKELEGDLARTVRRPPILGFAEIRLGLSVLSCSARVRHDCGRCDDSGFGEAALAT